MADADSSRAAEPGSASGAADADAPGAAEAEEPGGAAGAADPDASGAGLGRAAVGVGPGPTGPAGPPGAARSGAPGAAVDPTVSDAESKRSSRVSPEPSGPVSGADSSYSRCHQSSSRVCLSPC
ncbi:hypothetical protein [Streptomyces sp. NPDC048361]|uniref:hypothetical protein n=1 Tax=Streptomyces sp. NPDC048361 TaxID=3154720 RepID=UPI00342E6095